VPAVQVVHEADPAVANVPVAQIEQTATPAAE
jgi:hypothetical protein